jgi:hypothetical protein
MIEHDANLSMLKHYGFDDHFIGWIRSILAFGTSSVLLNCVPGKIYHCRRCWDKVTPFTYLSLPLGLCRPRNRDLGPLYSRINHHLAATTSFLSLDGIIMVTNAILSCLPTFYLRTFRLADGAIEILDKSRRISARVCVCVGVGEEGWLTG